MKRSVGLVLGALVGCGADATAPVDGDDVAVDSAGAGDSDVAVDSDTAAVDSGVAVDSDMAVDSAFFTHMMPWDRPVAGLAPHADSGAMIAALIEGGGWGNDDFFQIDFSIRVLTDDGSTVPRAFEPNDDFYEGDCDLVPVPLPPGGALEGEDGYACASDGDCHLIVRTPDTLYEMWRANVDGGTFHGGCLAVWALDRDYPESLRGEGCTSADAAGLPIAPLLFTADEVAAGEIAHAIRFILPNERISHRRYVRPATHATGAAEAGELGMPYGVRLRLRADYPVATLPSEGARVVARALQRYGMILADGGQIALTAAYDERDRWGALLGPHDLGALAVGDFEVVDMGERFDWDGDCRRNP